MSPDNLTMVVPSRGRPDNAVKVIDAWHDTGAFGVGRLIFAIDADDPQVGAYPKASPMGVETWVEPTWLSMVDKLNRVALFLARAEDPPYAVGFAGDDHLPRSPGWAQQIIAALRDQGSGIAYGDDRMHGRRLSTWWVTTTDIVAALGRMVPAPVEHLYSDTSVMVLGQKAGCLTYVPGAVLEHVHPFASKTGWDQQYLRVNRPEQYHNDRAAYCAWLDKGLAADVATIRALREPADLTSNQ